jgi:hypothetical protein
MKRLLYFGLFSSLLFLASCGGWSDEKQSQIKNTCLGSGNYDCNCYLEKVMKAYPAPDDFNGLSEDQKKEVVKECVQESKTEDENLESF